MNWKTHTIRYSVHLNCLKRNSSRVFDGKVKSLDHNDIAFFIARIQKYLTNPFRTLKFIYVYTMYDYTYNNHLTSKQTLLNCAPKNHYNVNKQNE